MIFISSAVRLITILPACVAIMTPVNHLLIVNGYIQAFQAEYSFVQQQVATDKIPVALATALYTEINQAQSLQLQQTQLEA